jgi:LDH2 family malate/lactate/ureidoglycolate dehydrogenase
MRTSGINAEDARLIAKVLVTTDTWDTYLPGEMEWERRSHALLEGIALPPRRAPQPGVAGTRHRTGSDAILPDPVGASLPEESVA